MKDENFEKIKDHGFILQSDADRPKRHIRTNATFRLGQHPTDLEHPSGISVTVPNQTLPLNQLVNKYIRGMAVPANEDPYYLGELPDPNSMSKIDRELYRREVVQKISDAQETIKLAQEEQKQNLIKGQQAEISRLQKEQESYKTLKKGEFLQPPAQPL